MDKTEEKVFAIIPSVNKSQSLKEDEVTIVFHKTLYHWIVRFAKRMFRRLNREIRAFLDLDHHLTNLRVKWNHDRLTPHQVSPLSLTDQQWNHATSDAAFVKWVLDLVLPVMQEEPNWNFDTYSKKYLPVRHFLLIRFSIYDDSGERLGDFMFPNDANKHGWAPLLAIAYRLTQQETYLNRLHQLLLDWRSHFRVGWGSPYLTTLNVAQRLTNWIFCHEVLRLGNNPPVPLCQWLAKEAYREFLFLNLYNTSYYIHRNNYAFCESVAALAFLKTFPHVPEANTLYPLWQARLLAECDDQIDQDGFSKEGSLPYTRFIAEILVVAAALEEKKVLPTLRRLAGALAALCDAKGTLPGFGDASSERGYDFGVQENVLDSQTFLALCQFFLEERLSKGPGGYDIEYFFFTGSTSRPAGTFGPGQSRHFATGGYGISKQTWGHLVIDYANIGQQGRGGHGHCDIGSFCMMDHVGEVVVDPGTYLYSANRQIRNQYRSSEMHNITQLDNSEMCVLELNLFGVSDSPQVVSKVVLSLEHDLFEVVHSGFLIDGKRIPVSRSLIADRSGAEIRDTWTGEQPGVFRLHFAPSLTVRLENGVCILSRNKEDVWWIELPLGIKACLEDYKFSCYYGKAEEARRLILHSKSDGNENNFVVRMRPG